MATFPKIATVGRDKATTDAGHCIAGFTEGMPVKAVHLGRIREKGKPP